MTKKTPLALAGLVALTALAACSNPPRYTFDPPPPAQRLATGLRTVVVHDVSLPDYASAPEIAVQKADGSVLNVSSALWADDPVRGMTLALTQQLDASLSATVASDPWPLSGLPDAEVSVRVAKALAGPDGVYHLAGQYFVLAEGRRGGAAPFAIAVPMQGSDAAGIARAQSRAVAELAQVIAQGLAGR